MPRNREGADLRAGDGCTDLEVGQQLDGRYEVRAFLGAGAMGAVYRAFDRALAEEVALKVVHDDVLARTTLHDEVRIAQRVTHPNVCRTYDLEEIGGRHVLKMEYIAGETLAALRAAHGPIAIARAIAIGRGIAAGLAAAHAVGIIHRDLKPGNVMIAGDRVVLMDFGLAQRVTGAESDASGTPGYMSPEQMNGGVIDGRSDLYALGCLLYELLAGEPLLGTGTFEELRRRQRDVIVPDLRARRPEVPRWLARGVVDLLAANPASRPSGARRLMKGRARPERVIVPVTAVVAAVAVTAWFAGARAPTWTPDLRKLEPAYEENANAPAISPDGTQLAFISDRLDPQRSFGVFVMPFAGGAASQISTQLRDVDIVRWARDGKALYLLDGEHLIRHPLDGTPEISIAEDVGDFEDCGDALAIVSSDPTGLFLRDAGGARRAVVSGDPSIHRPRCFGDRIVYVRSKILLDRASEPIDDAVGEVWMVDRQGHQTLVVGEGSSTDPSFTPGGRSIVFVRHDRDGVHLHERELAGGAEHQLTFGAGPDIGPEVSPDGETLVFDRDITSSEIYTGIVGGSPVRVVTPREMFAGLQPTHDGRRLVGMRYDPDGTHVVAVDVASGQETDLGPGEDAFLSADDRRVYFHRAAEPDVLRARSLDGGEPEAIATLPGAIGLGTATADGVHVVVYPAREGWAVVAGHSVDEHAPGLVIPAPSGPWRAVARLDTVELTAPGQPSRSLACFSSVGAWLDDHHFACATDNLHVESLDVTANTKELLFAAPWLVDDVRLVVAPGTVRWSATVTHGEDTRYVIANFGERPWKP